MSNQLLGSYMAIAIYGVWGPPQTDHVLGVHKSCTPLVWLRAPAHWLRTALQTETPQTTAAGAQQSTYFWPGCEAVGPPNLVGAQAAKEDIQGAGTAPLQQLDQCSTDGTCHKLKE